MGRKLFKGRMVYFVSEFQKIQIIIAQRVLLNIWSPGKERE